MYALSLCNRPRLLHANCSRLQARSPLSRSMLPARHPTPFTHTSITAHKQSCCTPCNTHPLADSERTEDAVLALGVATESSRRPGVSQPSLAAVPGRSVRAAESALGSLLPSMPSTSMVMSSSCDSAWPVSGWLWHPGGPACPLAAIAPLVWQAHATLITKSAHCICWMHYQCTAGVQQWHPCAFEH